MQHKIRVGVYGINGHQITGRLVDHTCATLVAAAGVKPESLKDINPVPRIYENLSAMLADKDVELVSLCSPRRSEQAQEAMQCMKAGKHVYAEKPCAMTEKELDLIIETSRQAKVRFHEMAGTAFEQPYLAMRELVASGTIGTVVQVLAQKSYPYFDARPQDEDVDGGLLLQVGIHAARFVEHVAGVKIAGIDAVETKLGNPNPGNLRMAVSMNITLENGGVASIISNYLNPKSFPSWGNETLRIFGTKGFVETVDGGTKTRLVLGEKDCGQIDIRGKPLDYFDTYIDSLLGKGNMPLSLEDELHPLRMLIRAREKLISR
jgi:predicted dehydrogenase